MKIYLIFGIDESICNNNYLYGIATTILEAQEKVQQASFDGNSFEELDGVFQNCLLTEIKPVNKDDINFITGSGIYEVEI